MQEPKAENRRRSRKDTTDWVAEKLWTERGKPKAGPKANLAENGMESAIRENAFAILNCRPPSMNIDATS